LLKALKVVGRRDGQRMGNTHSVGHEVRLTVIQQTNSENTFAVTLAVNKNKIQNELL
jgi:hypothetical protein